MASQKQYVSTYLSYCHIVHWGASEGGKERGGRRRGEDERMTEKGDGVEVSGRKRTRRRWEVERNELCMGVRREGGEVRVVVLVVMVKEMCEVRSG